MYSKHWNNLFMNETLHLKSQCEVFFQNQIYFPVVLIASSVYNNKVKLIDER